MLDEIEVEGGGGADLDGPAHENQPLPPTEQQLSYALWRLVHAARRLKVGLDDLQQRLTAEFEAANHGDKLPPTRD